ncbi:hypothetical protein [Paenibacillus chitinolyticus]|uniref:hypothetical protein n=1 Tax=Paenibacillus chitinolyticus TaxID=79263 RepID=UPI003670E6BB
MQLFLSVWWLRTALQEGFSSAEALLEITPYWHHTCLGGNVKCVFFGSGGVKIREMAGRVFFGMEPVGFGLVSGGIWGTVRED